MKPLNYLFIFFAIIMAGCSENSNERSFFSNTETASEKKIDQNISAPRTITWNDSDRVEIKINERLSYKRGFTCDSVIAVSYRGYEGEHFFFPLNKRGEWISSIHQEKVLNPDQIDSFNAIIGNKDSYKNPIFTACFEPNFALVYFRKNVVIAQTQISLSCGGLISTAKIGDPSGEGLLNDNAIKEFYQLTDELGFKR